jgi:hypothetical protein
VQTDDATHHRVRSSAPKKISRAIGISPRLAAAAVSISAAYDAPFLNHGIPCGSACILQVLDLDDQSELRIRIPIRASTPRIATNPRGAPLGSNASTTLTASCSDGEALQLNREGGRPDEQHQRNDGLNRSPSGSATLSSAALATGLSARAAAAVNTGPVANPMVQSVDKGPFIQAGRACHSGGGYDDLLVTTPHSLSYLAFLFEPYQGGPGRLELFSPS